MRRFRLLSLLFAMLIASGLLWLNLQGRWKDSEQQPYFAYFGTWDCGWPWTAMSHEAMLFHWKDYKESLAQKGRELDFNAEYQKSAGDPNNPYLPPVDHPRGTILIEKRQQLYWSHIALNTLVVIAVSAVALFACEFLLRRRESRAHAS